MIYIKELNQFEHKNKMKGVFFIINKNIEKNKSEKDVMMLMSRDFVINDVTTTKKSPHFVGSNKFFILKNRKQKKNETTIFENIVENTSNYIQNVINWC